MKTTLPELIRYIREKIPRLRLYDVFMILCLVDKELVGRRGFSLTGLEWYNINGYLYWKDESEITDIEVTREAQEVIDQIVKSAEGLNDKQLRDLVNQEF